MDGMRLTWTVPPGKLAGNVGDYVDRLLAAVFDLMSFFSAKIEAFAKQSAPWQDRTGNARQALFARTYKTAVAVTLVLAHGMDYGIWLEVKNTGKFAVILPTLEQFYPQVMSAMNALVRG